MSSFVATIILVVRDFLLCSTEHSLLVVPRARSHFESFFSSVFHYLFSFFLSFVFVFALFCFVLFFWGGGGGGRGGQNFVTGN